MAVLVLIVSRFLLVVKDSSMILARKVTVNV